MKDREKKLNIVFPMGEKPHVEFHESRYAEKDCYIYWDMDYLKLSPSWMPKEDIKHKEVYAINGMQDRIKDLKEKVDTAVSMLETAIKYDPYMSKVMVTQVVMMLKEVK